MFFAIVSRKLINCIFRKQFEEELEEFRNEKKLEERRQRYYEHEVQKCCEVVQQLEMH